MIALNSVVPNDVCLVYQIIELVICSVVIVSSLLLVLNCVGIICYITCWLWSLCPSMQLCRWCNMCSSLQSTWVHDEVLMYKHCRWLFIAWELLHIQHCISHFISGCFCPVEKCYNQVKMFWVKQEFHSQHRFHMIYAIFSVF